jgi:hypothetical protein
LGERERGGKILVRDGIPEVRNWVCFKTWKKDNL